MAGEVATCQHCRAQLEIAPGMRGGLVNCTRCGRVVEVPGLHDPAWVLLWTGVVAAAGLTAWFVGQLTSPWLGATAAAAVLALAWLVSRAL